MRQLTLDEVKKIEVEILDVVTKFCDERGINYFLDSGTLLGAVRHKGFIPWDDDIDIGMLRPDYDRFMREFNGYNPRYEFRCIENDPNFVRAFGRVFDTHTIAVWENMEYMKYGVNIDVFVFDNAPDDDRKAERMYRLRDFYHRMNLARLNRVFGKANGKILRRVCVYALRMILRIFPRNYFTRKLIENSRRYISEETKRIGNFTGYDPIFVDKRTLNSLIDLEFEGKNYKAPVGYDEWLTKRYGDYMTPLPPEKRTRHNPFIAYMKDNIEKECLNNFSFLSFIKKGKFLF